MSYGRIVIGGPSNSGKSAFAILLRNWLNQIGVRTYHRDYDPFSPTREYALKKINNKQRIALKKTITSKEASHEAKLFSTKWSKYDLVIGDLPGTTQKTTEILASAGTHAIILCSDKKSEEIKNWNAFFDKIQKPIICIIESNLNGIEEITDGKVIHAKLSNLDRENLSLPPYSQNSIDLAMLISQKLSIKKFS